MGSFSPRNITRNPTGGVTALQHGKDTTTATSREADSANTAWSEAFDCTARASPVLQVQLPGQKQCSVAMSTNKVGLQWQVVLQPSHKLVNQTAGPGYIHYTGQLAQPAADAGAAANAGADDGSGAVQTGCPFLLPAACQVLLNLDQSV